MVFACLNLKRGRHSLSVCIHKNSRINIALNAEGESIEFLLASYQLLELQAVLVLSCFENKVKPLLDIANAGFAVLSYLLLCFSETIQVDKFTLNCVFNCVV